MHVIRAAQVFDGERFLGESDVVVDGSTVLEVSPPRQHASEVTVEELGDVTVVPGLVDAHQHLTWDCSPDPVAWHRDNDDEALLARARANARRALAAGITTVRDLGGRGHATLDLRSDCQDDLGHGPRLLVSGAPLTTRGGHCYFLGGECTGSEELVRAVRRRADAGVDVIKVMATGGNVTPGSAPHDSQFSVDELRAVVEAAHVAGLPVAAHAHGTSGVADALRAGVDTIEHCSFMTRDGVATDPDLVARLAAAGVPVSITGGAVPGPLPPAIAARLPALYEHSRRLMDAGVRCILSTDAGIGPPKPHDVLPHTLGQAVEILGVPVADALAMATSRAADAIGVGDRAGRLRRGMTADVLIVSGDVSADATALLRPVRVLRAGVAVG